jgi:signal peptidase
MLKKAISIIALIILIPIIFINGVILIDSYIHPDEVPSFFGWKPFIVLSGSMQSEIYPGDIAVVKEIDTSILKENDIIAFKENDIVVTHRIVKIEEENGTIKYITKGDNNSTEDNGYVLPEQVEGLYQFKINRLGNLAMFIQTPLGMIVCLSIPIFILILVQAMDSRKSKKYIKEKREQEKDLKQEIEILKRQNEELRKK